ncbi:MAG: hypothetical protein K5871_11170 [Lachnospiraceae bacterium]|nr:hypothetical protein [Lachnospiraceae bacterium]
MNDKLYGIYNGEIYRIRPDVNGKVFLFPDDGEDITHAKVASSADISEAYRLCPYAEYKGIRTDVARETDDEYELWINDYAVAQELGFDRCDKYGYNMMVRKTDVIIFYEKKPYTL